MAETSAADPQALLAYADTGLRIGADLDVSATRLGDALAEFAATCREYPLGIDASLADPLRALTRRTVEHDLWVRRVAEQFALADTGVILIPSVDVSSVGSAGPPGDLLAEVSAGLRSGLSATVDTVEAGASTVGSTVQAGLSGLADVWRGASSAPDTTGGSLPAPTSGGMLGSLAIPEAERQQNADALANSPIVKRLLEGLDPNSPGNQAIANALTAPQPWMENVVALGTKQLQADTGTSPYEPGQQQLTPAEQYVEARSMADGLVQTLVPEDLVARAATSGAGSLVRSAEVLANTVAPDARRLAAESSLPATAGEAVAQTFETRLQELAGTEALRLRAEAAQAEPAVTSHLQDLSAQRGGELVPLDNVLKSEASLTRKIADDAVTTPGVAENPAQAVRAEADGIGDALRYTVRADPQTYAQTYANMKQDLADRGFQLIKDKNTWAEPGSVAAGPYRGINTTWRTPDGQLFELQFHTPESFAAKTEMHAMYEELRAVETSPERVTELTNMMIERSDLIPVPPSAIEVR